MFGYKDIDKLTEGEFVLSYNERFKKNEYKRITKKIIFDNLNEELYKITLDDNTVMEVTKFHKVYVERDGKLITIAAIKTVIGDYMIYSNFEKHKIVKIEHKSIDDVVYNIMIDDNHNFYVGYNEILVHNPPNPCTKISCKEPS
jgi:intein/homing endonuclease